MSCWKETLVSFVCLFGFFSFLRYMYVDGLDHKMLLKSGCIDRLFLYRPVSTITVWVFLNPLKLILADIWEEFVQVCIALVDCAMACVCAEYAWVFMHTVCHLRHTILYLNSFTLLDFLLKLWHTHQIQQVEKKASNFRVFCWRCRRRQKKCRSSPHVRPCCPSGSSAEGALVPGQAAAVLSQESPPGSPHPAQPWGAPLWRQSPCCDVWVGHHVPPAWGRSPQLPGGGCRGR